MTFCVVWSTIMLLWIAQAKHLPSLEHLETVFEILCSQESSLLPVRSWNCQATDGWLQRMLSYCPPNRSLCHIINKWAKLQLNGMLSHPQEEIKLLGSTVQGPLYVTHLTALQKKKKKTSFLGKVAPQEDGEPSQGKGQVRQASVSPLSSFLKGH